MSRGEANGVKVECFRDTGSSVSIVRSSLVQPDQYIGKEVTCILVDQRVKKCPQAEIMVTRRPASADRTARADNFRQDLE